MRVTIKAVLGFVGTVIAALSALLIIVDGVAIIFTYASLVFALLSIGVENKGILKIYGVVFVIAHLVFGWRMYSDINSSGSYHSSAPPDFKHFEKCSNKMFQNVEGSQIELTPENKVEFERCMRK